MFGISTCIQISNPKCSAVLSAKMMLTSDFSVKGHTHAAHSVVSRSCNLTGTPRSMSGKAQEEKIRKTIKKKTVHIRKTCKKKTQLNYRATVTN